MAATKRWVRFARWALPIALAFAFFGWRSYKFIESKRLSPPLIAAVNANDVERARSLLKRGADPNARDIPNAPTDFWVLLKTIVRPDPSKRSEAYPTALVLAAEQENAIDMVRLLLRYGANARLKRPDGGTVLTHMLTEYSSNNRAAETFKLLLDHDADPDASFESKPLLLLAYDHQRDSSRWHEDYPDYLSLLLDHKANPNVADENGRSFLKLAMDDEKIALAIRLLNSGADPNRQNDGRSPLLDAVQNRNPEVARVLLEKKADPNRVDPEGTSPLMVAAFNGNVDIVQELLRAGAKPGLVDSEGKTARQYAADSPKVIALLQSGAEP